jgi:arylsulfatase A-like enzyme
MARTHGWAVAARRVAAVAGVLGLLVLGSCTRAERAPNILLISIDTLRADHLGAYGYARNTSPTIDALARGGALFENAWSVSSWTLPAHVSMLTGLPISAHAQCDWDLAQTTSVPSHLPRGRFVAEDLAQAGYDTAGFYTCIYLEPKFGFGAGFKSWKRAYHSVHSEPGVAEAWQAARDAGDAEVMRRIHSEHPELFDVEARSSPELIDSALGWLQGRGGRRDPFFLFLHLYDVHSPYTPPAPFNTRFDPDYTGTVDGRKLGEVDSPVHLGMDPRDLEHVIALYDGEIAALDHELARLFEALERSGLAKDTLVILTSDHGEEFFEHGGKQHGGNLYRETLQVPLILKWPGHIAAGTRFQQTVGLIDIVPSVLAAAQLQSELALPGLDLVAVANGKKSVAAERTLTGGLIIRRGVDEPVWMSSLVSAQEHSIVHSSGAPNWSVERFDLQNDPRERATPHCVDAESPDSQAVLERLEHARRELQRLRASAPTRAFSGDGVLAQERAQLDALGYSAGAAGPTYSVDRLCFDGCIWRP